MHDDVRRGLLGFTGALALTVCACAGTTPAGGGGAAGVAGATSGTAGDPGSAGTGSAGMASGAAGSGSAGTGAAGATSGTAGATTGAAGAGGGAGASGSAGGAGASGTAGGGGSAGKGASPDAGAAGATGAPDGGAYPPENAEVDKLCTPTVTFTNMFPTTKGGMRFDMAIPDPVATMQETSRTICRWIFRKPEDVKKNAAISLVIDQHGGVAQTGGARIQFDANYIGGIGGNADAISFEIHGVLAHEDTHIWQYANGGGALVEAMADYVRFRSGYDKISRRRPGGNWSDPYTTGGFFIVWVEDKFDKDWGYKLNMGMKTQGFDYATFIMQTFGKTADALWAEYQADISH